MKFLLRSRITACARLLTASMAPPEVCNMNGNKSSYANLLPWGSALCHFFIIFWPTASRCQGWHAPCIVLSDSPLENAQALTFKEQMCSTQTMKYNNSFFHSFGCGCFKYPKICEDYESPVDFPLLFLCELLCHYL